ncbi:unnamed protein product [Didymodactylos carnosus]|uniref:LamG domain-containing protein n=1 Tax=Didymodactylos carnosus TaxID=1234261 RepID=A0A815WN03_9BILA|nr:unnamed protein product [Didymodactylos carnosus]CAF4406317.1 unnamed protein product [Didymodactylos carnosus]
MMNTYVSDTAICSDGCKQLAFYVYGKTTQDNFDDPTLNSGGYYMSTCINLTVGIWYHIAASVGTNPGNSSTYKVVLYLNGMEIQSSVIKPFVFLPGDGIHCLPYIGYYVGSWDGDIAEVRVWNYVRTPAQILTYANQRFNQSDNGLIFYASYANNLNAIDPGTSQTFSATGGALGVPC